MKIACLGTSANPPHLGHLKIAQIILRKKLVDQVWIIPSHHHAFGKPLLPWKCRWSMVKMLTNKRIKACDIESKRRGKSYTVGTVLALKKQYPQHEFYWIIGADIVQKKEYLKWHKWEQLKNNINFIVLQRSGYVLSKPSKVFNKIIKFDVPISSTQIRSRLSKNLSINRLVTPKIAKYLKYLQNHNLLSYK
jgi:nicotinate-nucleotide adenylyltransferase